eukprot:3894472-Lingulodinium_polyedra.AAC.1
MACAARVAAILGGGPAAASTPHLVTLAFGRFARAPCKCDRLARRVRSSWSERASMLCAPCVRDPRCCQT